MRNRSELVDGNEKLESSDDLLEAKVEIVKDNAKEWQDIYVETLESQPVEEDLENIVECYFLVMEQVNKTHNALDGAGYDDLAEEMVGAFEDVIMTQSKYKQEVREALGYTPADLFKQEYGL